MSAKVIHLPVVRDELQRIAKLLAEHPEVRERTAAWLAGNLSALEVFDMPKMIQLGTRVPETLGIRCDELIPLLESYEGIRALGREVTRSTVVRMALERGLASLEAEAAEKDKATG